MTTRICFGLALGSLLCCALHAAGFADRVIHYNPGAGFATEFGTGLGFTNVNAVLGAPSRITSGEFGGPVDPFNPPYLRDQLLSIGAGGSLTLHLDSPILNDPSHPFGLDFIIFGNAGFIITNGNFAGGGVTDGTLFAANSGTTRVSVSADNIRYLTLDPTVAPVVDSLFPTDGLGDFHQPVNPALGNASFGGLGLPGIRSLYGGSAGGTAYDLSWALDEAGRRVGIENASYLRIDVLGGTSEIDGVSFVPDPLKAPKPAGWVEDFSTNPLTRSWKTFGNAELFRWNADAQHLEVTWDSRETNSYFYHPLGIILAKDDDFSLTFDLRLSDIKIGVQTGQPFTFQLAAGFIHFASATSGDFLRGTGRESPNVVEFNYFADSGFGATVSPIIISTNNQFIPSFTFPLEMTVGDQFTVQLTYDASTKTLRTNMTRNREAFGPVKEIKLPSHFTDFRVDTVAVNSYASRGSDGSLLARGIVDNIKVVVPDSPISNLRGQRAGDRWQVDFTGRSGWLYTLEQTADFVAWTTASSTVGGTGQPQRLDSPFTNDHAFYRIRAERP